MKKFVLGALVALGAFGANASYLYWQVSGDETWVDTPGFHSGQSTLGDALASISGNYTGFRYYIYGTSDLPLEYGSTSALTTYNVSTGTAYVPESPAATENAYIDVGDIGNSTAYSFYIEIQGYTATSTEVVARSDIQTYANLNGYLTSDLGGIASAQVAALTGPSYAAPEPTGAMLLLVGGALLALKRKRV